MFRFSSSFSGVLGALAVLGSCSRASDGPTTARPPLSSSPPVTYPATPRAAPPIAPPPGAGLDVKHERYIVVDQFGYRPPIRKVAVLANPERGWNAGDEYLPSATLEVRRWADASVAFSGSITPWNGGALDESAGDRGAWFDFSKLTEPGLYYVYDPEQRVRSHPFRIDADVYRPVLEAAFKVFYFNRANVERA